VGVYATPEAYAAANGLGSTVPVGVRSLGRVNLSPKLFSPQHQRLRAILTHEVSHAHIAGWIGGYAYVKRLPNWFKEGLAVMVSAGGAQEWSAKRSASRNSARRANSDRRHWKPMGFLHNLETSVAFGSIERLQRQPLLGTRLCWPTDSPECLCNYLRETDGPAFDRMNERNFGRPRLAEAVNRRLQRRRPVSCGKSSLSRVRSKMTASGQQRRILDVRAWSGKPQ